MKKVNTGKCLVIASLCLFYTVPVRSQIGIDCTLGHAEIIFDKVYNQRFYEGHDSEKKSFRCLKSDLCRKALEELYNTEKKYLADLTYLSNSLDSMSGQFKGKSHPQVFKNLNSRLVSLIGSVTGYVASLERIFLGEADWEDLVPEKNYFEQSAHLAHLYNISIKGLEGHPRQQDYVKVLEKNLIKRDGNGFYALLIKPLQRPPKLLLFIEDLKRKFPFSKFPSLSEFKIKRKFERIKRKMSGQIRSLNENIRSFEDRVLMERGLLKKFLSSPIVQQDQFLERGLSPFAMKRHAEVQDELRKSGLEKMPGEEIKALALMPSDVRKNFYKRINDILGLLPTYFQHDHKTRINLFNNIKTLRSALANGLEFQNLPPDYQKEIMRRSGKKREAFLKLIGQMAKQVAKGTREGETVFSVDHLEMVKEKEFAEEVGAAGLSFHRLPLNLKRELMVLDQEDRTYLMEKIKKWVKSMHHHEALSHFPWKKMIVDSGLEDITREFSRYGVPYRGLPLNWKMKMGMMAPSKRKTWLEFFQSLSRQKGTPIFHEDDRQMVKEFSRFSLMKAQNEALERGLLIEFNLLPMAMKEMIVASSPEIRKDFLKILKENSYFGGDYLGILAP